MEKSLVLIKPDAVQRGLTGKILSRLERRGLKIIALKMIQVDKTLAQRHYAIHKEKPFFNDLVNFITASPVVAAIFEGKNAIEVVRQTMGKTNSAEASPGTIRGDFGIDIQQNLVHGSDSVENAAKEIEIFFNPGEILSYTRDLDRWITGA